MKIYHDFNNRNSEGCFFKSNNIEAQSSANKIKFQRNRYTLSREH